MHQPTPTRQELGGGESGGGALGGGEIDCTVSGGGSKPVLGRLF